MINKLNISVRGMLLSVVSLLALMVIGLAGVSAWDAWNKSNEVSKVLASNETGALFLKAAANYALERGMTNTALAANAPASPATLDNIGKRRSAADSALKEAMERVRAGQGFKNKDKLLAEVDQALQALNSMRQRADADLPKAKDQRDPKVLEAWVPTIRVVIDSSQAVRVAAEYESSSADARLAQLQSLKHFVWVISEYAGRERANIGGMIAAGTRISPALLENLSAWRGRVELAWYTVQAAADKASADPKITAQVAQVADVYFGRFQTTRQAVYKAGGDGTPYPIDGQEWFKRATEGIDTLLKLSDVVDSVAEGVAVDAAAASRTTLIVGLGVLVIGFLFAALSFWLVTSRVTGPIVAMTGAMTKLADGDKGITVPALDRRDEIGQMAKAVEVFKQNAIENERLQAEQKAAEEEKRRQDEAARLAEEKRKEDEARREREAEEAKRAADERARKEREELEKAAAEKRKADMLALAAKFEASVKGVVEAVAAAATEMQSTAGSMAASAEETSRQATTVASASTQATTNVQTVAAAAEELSASIAEIGKQVAQSTRVAGEAVERAQKTNMTVKGLAEAAQKIGEVVGLINNIARQTNLLALNATIEAARAGEAGKGFAVVASEVKSLATQTSKATEEIGAQIAAIQSVTGEAVGAIEGIGGTIGDISQIATTIASAVEEQGAATQEIARNVQQAAAGTNEVSANIGGVTQAATETGTAANQMLGAASELSQQAEKLRLQVDEFLAVVKAA